MVKKMLKFLSVVTIIAMSATFVACNDKKEENTNSNVKQEKPNKQDAPVSDAGTAPEITSAPVGEGEELITGGGEQAIKTKICVPNAACNAVEVVEVEVREISAEEILMALCNEGVVKGSTEVIEFKQNGKSLELNLTQGFVDGIKERGTLKEHYTIASVVNSYLYNFKAENITILVDGKTWKTNQAEYGFRPFVKIAF